MSQSRLFIAGLFLLIIVCGSCEQNRTSYQRQARYPFLKDLPTSIQNSIDSFIVSEYQNRFGIFAIYISRKRNGTSFNINRIVHAADIEEYPSGLPYNYDTLNSKLVLFYCGLEMLESPGYDKEGFLKLYKQYYDKYDMGRFTGLHEEPSLIIDTTMHGKMKYHNYDNENYHLWFEDVALLKKTFDAPTLETPAK